MGWEEFTLPSVFHVPGTVLGAFVHSLRTTVRSRYYCSYFMDGETETQMDEVTCPSHVTRKQKTWVCSQIWLCRSSHHPMCYLLSVPQQGCRIWGNAEWFLICKMFTFQVYEDKMR